MIIFINDAKQLYDIKLQTNGKIVKFKISKSNSIDKLISYFESDKDVKNIFVETTLLKFMKRI